MSAEERLKNLTRNESVTSATASAASPTSPAVSPNGVTASTAQSGDTPEQDFKIPPRKSSLSLKERRAVSYRKTSSASFGGKPTPPLLEGANGGNMDNGFFQRNDAVAVNGTHDGPVAGTGSNGINNRPSTASTQKDENHQEKQADSPSSLETLESRTKMHAVKA
jgi:hypothetical protein